MAAYAVRHGYAATRDGRRFGPWQAGDIVDLDPADAEWVERDSPGALAPAEAAPEPARQARTGGDRQHRGGRDRGA